MSQLNGQETRLLRSPDISQEQICFVYANDIWLSDHEGQNIQRLTSFEGGEHNPHFSPDGQWIAFSGEYDGNIDVYLVPVRGGEPKRLTYHPSADQVKGWTPDGQQIVFESGREGAPFPLAKFWTVNIKGGLPVAMPLDRVYEGQVSDDGQKIVYQKVDPWESEFRNYRGGQNNPIRIFEFSTMQTTKLPWDGSTDINPVFAGDDIYFLSDRNTISNIWKYSVRGVLSQVTDFKEFDCKQLESGAGLLVFENGGFIYLLDPLKDTEAHKIPIEIRADFSWARPHWKQVSDEVSSAAISPSGVRAVFSARGDVFTVPKEYGDVRNITSSSGAADREPCWSPNGQWISWFSDETGEYALYISSQTGENRREIKLDSPTFYYTPAWSPDSKYLSYTDADRNLWIVDISSGEQIKIDNEKFAHPIRNIYPEWAPDSKWLAYSRRLASEFNAIFIYSIADKKSYQLTDGLSDCLAPAWDASGKYLYFLSSINFGLGVGWLDMSSIEREQRFNVFMAVLDRSEKSPLAPKSDEEENEAENPEQKEKEDSKEENDSVVVKISWEDINQRILALNLPAKNYFLLEATEEGHLLIGERTDDGNQLHGYNLEEDKAEIFLESFDDIVVSADRNSMLYQQGSTWYISEASSKPSGGEKTLDLGGMRMVIDPSQEWKQIFNEACRYERDFFYVENIHGLDMEWIKKSYSPWLDHVRHRTDLTYLLDIIGGETSVGHSFTGGGDEPSIDRVPVGLLGVDFEMINNHYRIKKIYNGENWNANLTSPLSGPGIDVPEGAYLLAVNGIEVRGDENIYRYFEYTADKQVVLKITNDLDDRTGREITVIPVASEYGLRQLDWVENNRRKVDSLSDGQLAYVWLPNTGNGGFNNFNRYYFSQKNKKGAIIDERFNQGGFAADYIVDLLNRELMGYFNNPVGDKQPQTSPIAALYGPKVMIINEMAGSGGDYLPYMFKKKKIGPLVGMRTWGGLVGIWDVPPLVDGGFITAPRGGFFNTEGEWDIENVGVSPDIEMDQDAKAVYEGGDPQLEKAIETALDLLKTNAIELKQQPPDPVRARKN